MDREVCAVGTYQLGPDLTATFDDGDSITVMTGQLTIQSIIDTTLPAPPTWTTMSVRVASSTALSRDDLPVA